jgi:predicted dehydrogenase
MSVRVVIIGSGLIGRKRASALQRDDELVGVIDVVADRAIGLARDFSSTVFSSLREVPSDDVDCVIVATPHNELLTNAQIALELGCDVLVEKPGARTSPEITSLRQAAAEHGGLVGVGFNHRFNPAFIELRELALSGEFGRVMAIRGRYGHGGRVGYEGEWRADPWVSGGGELVDQGFHLIDLARELVGELPVASALARTVYWDMPVDDSAVIVLGDAGLPSGAYAVLHATCAEWKNTFELEVWCETAKFRMSGLQGSYGAPQLTVYRMRPEMGPPDTDVVDYEIDDSSWGAEWRAFKERKIGRGGVGDLEAAQYAHRVADEAYGDVEWRR